MYHQLTEVISCDSLAMIMYCVLSIGIHTFIPSLRSPYYDLKVGNHWKTHSYDMKHYQNRLWFA